MKRLLSTRYGFFGTAALVCWAMLIVIEAEHRWVAIGLGALYALLSLLFLLDAISGDRRRPPVTEQPSPGD
jgi:O-antigen ligase